jgi:hypothetical protein
MSFGMTESSDYTTKWLKDEEISSHYSVTLKGSGMPAHRSFSEGGLPAVDDLE